MPALLAELERRAQQPEMWTTDTVLNVIVLAVVLAVLLRMELENTVPHGQRTH